MTRGAQVATVAMAAVAGAAFVFGIPGTKPEPVALEPVSLDPIRRPAAVSAAAPPDALAVADRFSTIANAPKPPAPPPVADTSMPGDATNPTPVAPPPTPDNIKYLGHVGLGSTLFAMISENQRQAMVGVNDELSAGRVVEITPTELTLDQDGRRKVIELAAKSGSAISMVMPGAANSRGQRGGQRPSISPQDIMARSRPAPQPMPSPAMLTPDQLRQQAWDDHFNTATNRLMESGMYKDDAQAKQAAARYADEMARIEQDILNGDDPEKIEYRRKELDENVFQGSPK